MNEKLVALRIEKGWSQAKTAIEARVNRITYLNVEHGRTPELETAVSIADVFGIKDMKTFKEIFLPFRVDGIDKLAN